MTLDYGAEMPEINSGRIYTGAGSGGLMATAAAWEEQAAELMAGAAQLAGVIGTLGASWEGPSSESMVASLMPYLAWMLKSAATAEQTSIAHASAAAAHDAAFLGVVPPPVITANRTTLATLVATNFLGVNTPAIAATEAQYAEMWAQDAATLSAYSSSMAAMTSGLAADPFLPALPTTVDGGLGAMADASGQAAGQVAGTAAQTATSAGDQAGGMGGSLSSLGGMASSAGQALTSPLNSMGQLGSSLMSPMSSMFSGMGGQAGSFAGGMGLGSFAGLGASASGGFGGGSPVSASMGRSLWLPGVAGLSDGKQPPRLSVPATWAGAVERGAVAKESSVASAITQEEAAQGTYAGVPRGAGMMPMGGMGGMGGHGSAGAAAISANKRILAMSTPKVVPDLP